MELREVPLLVLDAVNMQVSKVAIYRVQVISEGPHGEVALDAELALVHQLDGGGVAYLEGLLLEHLGGEALLLVRILQHLHIDVKALGGGSAENHDLLLVDSGRALQVDIDEVLVLHDDRLPSRLDE